MHVWMSVPVRVLLRSWAAVALDVGVASLVVVVCTMAAECQRSNVWARTNRETKRKEAHGEEICQACLAGSR